MSSSSISSRFPCLARLRAFRINLYRGIRSRMPCKACRKLPLRAVSRGSWDREGSDSRASGLAVGSYASRMALAQNMTCCTSILLILSSFSSSDSEYLECINLLRASATASTQLPKVTSLILSLPPTSMRTYACLSARQLAFCVCFPLMWESALYRSGPKLGSPTTMSLRSFSAIYSASRTSGGCSKLRMRTRMSLVKSM
mmetsp:Transcript_41114/g.73934  ORF Transcript_41114/g.73934 Transcript_41114/m.73934 type:complete len:200 (+) Transcript_41114:1202-1801(+)